MATMNIKFNEYMRQKSFSPASVRGYTDTINSCLEFIGKPETEITANDMAEWREYMAEHYSTASMDTHIGRVKSYFKCLYDNEIIEKNVAKAIVKPHVYSKQKHHMTMEQIRAMVKVCDANPNRFLGTRDKAIIILATDSGMRFSEFAALTVTKYMALRKANEHSCTIIGKGNKMGQVSIDENACKAIDEYLKYRNMRNYDNDYLFLSIYGNQVSDNKLNKMLKKVAKEAGIEWYQDFSAHQLRAAFATIQFDHGCTVEEVQQRMRHSDYKTTLRYTKTGRETIEGSASYFEY